MIRKLLLAVAFVAAPIASAQALVLDFTVGGTPTLTGTIFGGTVDYTISGDPNAPNNNESYNGGAAPTNSLGLAFVKDGFGINDDELTATVDSITIDFFSAGTLDPVNVRLEGFAFLDLFQQSGTAGESGRVDVSGSGDFAVVNFLSGSPGGYAENIFANALIGSQFVFTAGLINDNQGKADGALAAIKVSAVPIPAALPLFLTSLLGLYFMGRKRRRQIA